MARRTVLITGASTGIGRASALALAEAGWDVRAGVRKAEDGERLRAEAKAGLTPVILDVTEQETIDVVAASIGDESLHGLINNAGIGVPGPIERIPLAELRRQLEVNLVGQVAVTQAMLPALRRAPGRIVNVTSVGGRVASPFLGAYVASKFALEAITDSLRMELRPWGIDVIAVEPGSVKTEIWESGQTNWDRIRQEIGEEGERLYGEATDALEGAIETTHARGISADRVAGVIRKALESRRPRTRYLVGSDARVMIWMRRLLPARVADAIFTRQMGLPQRAPDSGASTGP